MQAGVLEVYAATFAARQDAYAAWNEGWACKREPLTTEVIEEALRGKPVSSYLCDAASRTHIAAVDFDTATGMAQAHQLAVWMHSRGLVGYIESSRENRAHLWCPIDVQIPNIVARRALKVALEQAGLGKDPKIELRPSHDRIDPEGFGSPLRMPLMRNPKTGQRGTLTDVTGKSLGKSLDAIMLAVDCSPSSVWMTLAEQYIPTGADIPIDARPPRPISTTDESASQLLMELWGVRNAQPGREIRCPAHEDAHPSLSILADDERVLCHSVGCVLNNNGRGRGTNELRRLAPR